MQRARETKKNIVFVFPSIDLLAHLDLLLSTPFFSSLSRARPPGRLRGLDLAAPESSSRGHPRAEALADDV